MVRAVAMSREELHDREKVFDNLIIKSLKRSLRPVTTGLHDLVTAAAPTLSPPPAEPNPTIPAGALGIVTTTWSEEVDAELFPYLVQTFVDAAAGVFPEIEEHAPNTPKITYDMAANLLAHAKNRLVGIGDVVWTAMRSQLAEGYQAGESMPQLAARLRTVASLSEPRALTIARTEVIPAVNFGSLHQVIAAGFTNEEVKKEWLATEDERTREAHVKADGQRVGLREPFAVGGNYLQVPGDPIGFPENIINCRCSVAFVFADDEEVEETDGDDVLTSSWEDTDNDTDTLGFKIIVAAPGDWTLADEAKHPRDKGTGKFKKKLAPDTIVSKVLKPVKMNSTTFLKTKYADGAVVAEKQMKDGVVRLRWYAPNKKFLFQKKQPEGNWKTIDTYNKTAAYKQFGNDTGWTEPSAVSLKGGAVTELVKAELKAPPVPKDKKPSSLGIEDFKKAQAAQAAQAVQDIKEAKAAQTATPTGALGVPIKLNTTTLLKTKYADGAVIAQKLTDDKLFMQRLVWDAGMKRFLLQGQMDNGDWISVESYTKTGAYQKFGKDTGWETPTVSSPATKKSIPTFNKSDQLDVISVYKMSDTEFNDWFGKNFVHDKSLFDSLGEEEKNFIVAKATEAANAGHSGAFQTLQDWGAGDPVDLLLSQPTPALVKSLAYMTPAMLENYTDEQLTKLEDKIPDLLNSGAISYTEAINYDKVIKEAKNVLPISGQDIPDFGNDSTTEILAWFDSLDQAKYDSLSASNKSIIASETNFFDVFTPLGQKSYSQKIADFGAGLGDDPTHTISTSSLPDISNFSSSEFFSWLDKLTQSKFDSYSDDDKKTIEDIAEIWAWMDQTSANKVKEFKKHVPKVPFATGFFFDPTDKTGPKGTGPVYMDGKLVAYAREAMDKSGASLYVPSPYSSAGVKYIASVDYKAGETVHKKINEMKAAGILKLFPTPTPAIQFDKTYTSGPAGSIPVKYSGKTIAFVKVKGDGTGAYIYDTDSDYYLKNKVGFVDFDSGQTVEEEIANLFDSGKLAATATVPSAPSPSAATFAPDASLYHVEVHSKIKPLSQISSPANPPSGSFKTISTSEGSSKQTEMLAAAGKTWTKSNIAAIKRYSTSVGYRSTNAVLRDDKKQQNLLSEQQLQDGIKNAVDLQDAMTPLLDNLLLYRGTGAHAFGQNSIEADFEKLKELEGKTLTDQGFMSTTTVANPSVGYDYTKKPIQMIIRAPAGTAAVHLDSGIPGHGENEFVLAAGTSYRIDEVRKADASDKNLYGDNVKHIVVVTIVPNSSPTSVDLSKTSGALPKPVPPAVPAAKPKIAPTPSPSIGNVTWGSLQTPIKMNTTTLIKTKYAHGAVVGYQKRLDPSSPDGKRLYRLAWQENSKRFVLQLQTDSGAWLNATNSPQMIFNKTDAYQAFGKQYNWYAPPPGDSALGTGGGFGATAPSVSGGGTVAPVVTPPAAPAVKFPKFDAAMLKAQHGDPPLALTLQERKNLWSKFKYGLKVGNKVITLDSTPSAIFKRLQAALQDHNSKSATTLNLLQALKILDEKQTAYSNPGTPFEDKIVEWLQTPSGKNTATKAIHESILKSAKLTTAPTTTVTNTAYPNEVNLALAQVQNPYDMGQPEPNVTSFNTLTANDALDMQKEQLAADPWTPSQKSAIYDYTTSEYITMNNLIRGESTGYSPKSDLKAARKIKFAQDGMRPIPYSIRLFRKTGTKMFPGLADGASFEQVKPFDGKVIQDKAFLSTSIDPNTWSGEVAITIDVPEGTPGIYVANNSEHSSELEFLLAAGLKYRILKIEQTHTYPKIRVHMRVEA